MNGTRTARLRAYLAFSVIVGAFISNQPLLLAALWCGLLVPVLLVRPVRLAYLRFPAVAGLPITLGLFFIWGWLLRTAPPGSAGEMSGAAFATLISSRLLLVAAVIQLCFVAMDTSDLLWTAKSLGLGNTAIVALAGSLALLPEIQLRLRQIVTAQKARGLLATNTWFQRLVTFPTLLPPLVGWVLRSAVQRGETWEHRRLLDLALEASPRKTTSTFAFWVVMSLLGTGWLALNLVLRFRVVATIWPPLRLHGF